MYSILTVLKLTAIFGVLKFYDPTFSEYKFHKMRIKNWLSIGFELRFPCLRTYCHNHYVHHAQHMIYKMLGSLKLLYSSSKSWNNPGDLSLPLTVEVLSKCTPSVHSSIKPQQKPTTVCLIIYRQST